MKMNDRKILARACRVYWHEYTISPDGKSLSSCLCGNTGMSVRGICAGANPSFITAGDWELARVNVVVSHVKDFNNFLWDTWAKLTDRSTKLRKMTDMEWWLTLSPEECCELAADFILANLNLFPDKIVEILGSSE